MTTRRRTESPPGQTGLVGTRSACLPPGDFSPKAAGALGLARVSDQSHPRTAGRTHGIHPAQVRTGAARRVAAVARPVHDGETGGSLRSDLDQVARYRDTRSEEHTSELQSPCNLVCRLLLEKKKKRK